MAVWSVREWTCESVQAQVPLETRSVSGGNSEAITVATPKIAAEGTVLRGMVLDSVTHEGLPGVTVLIQNSAVGVSTGFDGSFKLRVPAELVTAGGVALQISSVGYASKRRWVTATQPLQFLLAIDIKGLTEVVVTGGIHFRRPWPWHPRSFYNWSTYWLTRPFRDY